MAVQTTIIGALGPTNTGKTFRAIERMKEFPTGMFGLPLRLLAREVYDQLVKSIGVEFVALVTGEEKRIPLRARYWICTVEAMPVERTVDFLAVDEVQLAAHRQRGHIFTDRILNARGRLETWFIGSPSIRFILQNLIPTIELHTYERLSTLSSDGVYTLGQLPKRTAVVAFTAGRVYELAEHISNRRGGVAIVMGALSPRARNAQVQLFQRGDVDYLVSTDAIGMGLNLDVSRVAFADLRKYDGVRKRDLELAELSQIAGRAGRYKQNGSFGTLDRCRPLDYEVIRKIVEHRTEPLRTIFYRNSNLDFSSIKSLMQSLMLSSPSSLLKGAPFDSDIQVLEILGQDRAVREAFRGSEMVQLLWSACQIPNFRQLLLERQAEIALEIASEVSNRGALNDAFMNGKVSQLAEHAGGIDAIMSRIAQVRLWSYVSFRETWLLSPRRFQLMCAEIEDRLSDDLHSTLVERFVPRRAKTRARSNSKNGAFSGLASLHHQLLQQEDARLAPPSLLDAKPEAMSFNMHAAILFEGQAVGRIIRGKNLTFQVELNHHVKASLRDTDSQESIRKTVEQSLMQFLEPLLRKLASISWAQDSSVERGLAYQLREGLGLVSWNNVEFLIKELSAERIIELKKQGLLFGKYSLMHAGVLRGEAGAIRRLILGWSYSSIEVLKNSEMPAYKLDSIRAGVTPSARFEMGYRRVSGWWLRLDHLERLLRKLDSCATDENADQEKVKLVSQEFGIKLKLASKIADRL